MSIETLKRAAELKAMAEHMTQQEPACFEIQAEDWHSVEAFCRQHPGEAVKILYIPDIPDPSTPHYRSIPEGWQLVPIEPTPEMLDAVSWPNAAKTDYAHMLAAAPKPEMKE